MGLNHSPSIVSSGLTLCLDAANSNSYTVPSAISGALSVQVLIVAGGGAGGGQGSPNDGSGGGGAGGVILTGLTIPYNNVTELTLPVVVGLGGTGVSAQTRGNNGQNSSFGGLTAIGGGGGGSEGLNRNGAAGGSGGGAGGFATDWIGGLGTAGQGNAGGANRFTTVNNLGGGGGGGAGGAGAPGKDNGTVNTGIGGPGIASSISGVSTFYGGGGGCGGGYATAGSAGGIGGGGAGGNSNGPSGTAQNGQANTGGGGGGAGAVASGGVSTSGSGGSGIVIIRYAGPPQGYGGTITSVAGDTVHTFTASGNFVLTVDRWRDVSGQSNNGFLVGSPTFNSANGGFLTFNGSTNRVGPFLNQISGNGSKTICCFFRTNAVTRLGLAGTREIAGSNGWVFCVNRTTAGNLTYFHTGGSTLEVAAGIVTGTWYYGCVTYDLTTATATLYLNGALIGAPVTGFSPIVTSAFNGVVGAEDDANSNLFNGNIAQVSIYNRALSAAEISQNFNALRGRFGI